MPPYAVSPSLAHPRARHAFFGRQGGVSTGIYASLNAGPGSRDAADAVAENRARVASGLGIAPDRLLSLHQVHSARAIRVEAPWSGPRPEADALVTATPGLALTALAADCAPVLLADFEAGVIAAAHAGWKGALAGVLQAAVTEMEAAGARRGRIATAIGPCIGQASYEVGPEFVAHFSAQSPANERFFAPGAGDRMHFDLTGYCRAALEAAGVGAIDALGHDVCARADEYFSNRRAFKRGESDYGRNISAIMLTGEA
ncbi:MAG: peptidoglycan editing factor PgeF [Hyphomonadaceae bacterium]